MNLLGNDMALLRTVLLFGVLGIFLVAEAWAPFRAPVQSKLQHVATNLVIIGSNTVLLNLLLGGALLLWSSRVNSEGWGLLNQIGLGPVITVLISIVLLDLTFYSAHWANHRVPFLWRFHRAHHSDLDLDVSTGLRFHIGEVLVSTGVKAISIVALGVAPLGFLASEIVLLVAAQFQHSNLRLPERLDTAIRVFFVTPHMHWIHHSRNCREHNANFGTMLSWWDRFFGTVFMDVEREQIRLGLDDYPSPEHVGIFRFYLIPFGSNCAELPKLPEPPPLGR
jgi:sterol desaturase/sphingolipid hydroxylase (fatty acid hydroxylase superfamily)